MATDLYITGGKLMNGTINPGRRILINKITKLHVDFEIATYVRVLIRENGTWYRSTTRYVDGGCSHIGSFP